MNRTLKIKIAITWLVSLAGAFAAGVWATSVYMREHVETLLKALF